MIPEPKSAPADISIILPEGTRASLARISAAKKISMNEAALVMVAFAARMMDETQLHADFDLNAELHFSNDVRRRVMARADGLLGVLEKVALESQGLHRVVRNRALVAPKEL